MGIAGDVYAPHLLRHLSGGRMHRSAGLRGRNGSGDNEISPVLYSAIFAAFGAMAWIVGADIVLKQPGTPVQFIAAAVSGFVGGPLGLVLTEILNDELAGVTLATIVTGAIYTLASGMFPADQDGGQEGDGGQSA